MTRATPKTARKTHRCSCGTLIRPGERYIEHVASPDHDGLGNRSWWRIKECAGCAKRYGREVPAA